MTIGNTTYKIKNRLRFTMFVALCILIMVSVTNGFLGLSSANSMTEPTYVSVTIEPGDTLWWIADEYMDDNMDLRKAVRQICKINDISPATLQPGQVILVPVH